jgi:hypothetical protein
MQQTNTITLFATVSNAPSSRVSQKGRKYTSFGVAVRNEDTKTLFHYNVVAFGRSAQFAQKLTKKSRIKLVCTALNQPDNTATIPLLTAQFVCPVNNAKQQAAA